MDQIVPYPRQEQTDYVDNLLPGYRFCPTDSELILHYLKPKIETGKHPDCRIYVVNLYNYSPEELTNQHRACDNKWYFFTSRERKYKKGKVPKRTTGDFGGWKTTQKYTWVYHNYATGPRAVGTKRSLAYYDEERRKTLWLMQEYTVNDPNLPIESGQGDNKVLTDLVLCKIYKLKKSKEPDNTIVQAPHHLVFTREEIVECQQNHSMSIIPTNTSQFHHGASASPSTDPHVYIAQSPTCKSPFSDNILQQHHSMPTYRSEPHAHATQPPTNYASPVTNSPNMPLDGYEDISQRDRSMLHTTNNFQHSDGGSNSSSAEPVANHAAQPPAFASPMSSEDVDMDEIFARLDDFSTTPSVGYQDILEFDDSQYLSFEDLMSD